MIRLRSAFASIYVVALLAVAVSAARAQEPNWQLMTVPDEGVTASSVGPVTRHVYVLRNDAGINESPLPDIIKEDLLPPQDPYGGTIVSVEDDGEAVYAVSQEIVEGIVASENAGALTPEIEAIAEPPDEEEASSSGVVGNSIFGGSCATRQQTVHRVIDLADIPYNKTIGETGDSFTGNFSLTGTIAGTITADLELDIKRRNTLGKCVPYSVKFKTLHAVGNASTNGSLSANGTVHYSDDFGPWQIAKPQLFEFWIMVYYIPVRIGGNLPITAGLNLSADITGNFNYTGKNDLTGSFDYICTLDNCTGTHSFSGPDNAVQQIFGEVSGHIKPTPYVDVAFRAYLYSESVAWAQIGVRPYFPGDLWGYDGNNCGDADGNGVTETVRALTFDLDRRIDWTGKSEVLGKEVWDRTLSTGSTVHVGFYDLTNSTAMQPQIQGPPALNTGSTGQYKVKIRPCWPYTDKVTYQVDWGDGSAVQPLEGVPGTEVQTSHAWTTDGNKTVTATSLRDGHGRALNQSYSRTIQVLVPTPLGVIVTPSPGSATYGQSITWTATPTGGDPLAAKSYALFRRRAGTTPWIPDVTQPVWQASNTLTWTPAAADVGTWEIIVWIKEATTPANQNTYGYSAYANAGPVEVVPPLTLACPTPVQKTVTSGTTLSWTLSPSGGTPGTIQYAMGRQLVGTTAVIPDPPVWQTNNTLSWTPTSADVGTWTVFTGVKDVNTPANPGYSAYCSMGQYKVVPPLTLSVTPSPASSVYGNAITWTATISGGDAASAQYALFRRRAGATAWIPDVTAPAWQSSNVLSWTPTLADAGGAPWEIIVWAKDVTTPANANGYGFAAYANAGPVQVVTPPLTLSVTPSPSSSTTGTAISWTATANGGNPSTIRYAFFRRRAGTTPWTPDVTAPAWQTGNVFTWTPTSSDAGTWEIVIWVKDGDTPATMNTYGYAAYANAGPVQVVAPLAVTSTASPAIVTYGTTISWTATATGGVPGTIQYTLGRQLAGTTSWVPSPLVWQSGNVLSWTPTSSDVGTWTIGIGVKDANTAPNQNGYGYSAFTLPGAVKVVAPLTVTGTGSPASSPSGTTLNWTATAGGGDAATTRYAFFRRRAGTTPWTPDVTAPAWQSSNVLSWTPTSADAGTWEIVIWVKDGATPASMNTYGYAAYYNAGPVKVYNPITLTGTGSPSAANYGTALTWTATAGGGTPGTFQYALFRRRAGTTPWTPDVTAPAWQSSNVLSWTPTAADTGTWEIIVWVKDANTPASQNTYGYGAYYNAGPVRVVAPLGSFSCSSPVSPANYGTAFTWTCSVTGGDPATLQYALFRRRAGATSWTPDVTAPAWQSGNVLSWTPAASDVGTWDIIIWVRDGTTPANANGFGYAAYTNLGQVQVLAPLTLTGTGSPSSTYYGQTLTWTASASGGTGTGRQYALFRRRVGTTPWTPDVNAPAWQSSNVLSWTPASADTGTWEIIIWVKDSATPANMNGYGYAAYYNAGPVQVVTPLSLSGSYSPSSSPYGQTLTWSAYASGGTGTSVRYAFFRRKAGTSNWIPSVTSPAWQTSNTFSWTPTSADLGTWETYVWVKDSATPANMNTYGYAAGYNSGPVEITVPISQWYPPTGWIDGYDSMHVWGWACDPDYPTESNRVDIYTTSWQYLGSADANGWSSAPINSACGGGSAHYFDFYHWGAIASGTHFMAWSIDLPYSTPGNDNRPIGGSGSVGNGTEFIMP
jgi:hypothetical protein